MDDIYYPEADGEPLGETEIHTCVTMDLVLTLQMHFSESPEVHVGSDILLYYVEGDPKFMVSPDVYVVKGMDKELRRVYKVWEEGRVPSLVLEITSNHTRGRDLNQKKGVYERLGIEEYVLFDPTEDYLEPSLQGFRLAEGRYRWIETEPDGCLLSRSTNLTMRREGWNLRLIDAATGEKLLWPSEAFEASQALKQAEARVHTLEAELARLKAARSGG